MGHTFDNILFLFLFYIRDYFTSRYILFWFIQYVILSNIRILLLLPSIYIHGYASMDVKSDVCRYRHYSGANLAPACTRGLTSLLSWRDCSSQCSTRDVIALGRRV